MGKKEIFRLGLLFVMVTFLITAADQVQSQEKYPSSPIEIICPLAPGGGTDIIARLMAGYLKKKWGVPVNVVNKTGGFGIPATVDLYNSRPDGYTIFADIEATCSFMEYSGKDLPFKVMDRTFIGVTCYSPFVFMVPATSPHKTLASIMAEAKKDPANFSYVVGAINQDFIFRQLFKVFGVDFSKAKPVLSKGGAESTVMIAGGHVGIGTTTPQTCRAAVKAGNIRLLAVTVHRDPEFKDVPTTAELGYPSVNLVTFEGYSGPPKMSSDIVTIWENAFKEMLKDSDFLSRLATMGFHPWYLNSVQFKDYVAKQTDEARELFSVKQR
jgi:tripartite-type tricarboxylate transporter receptor subunit TctC